MGTAIATLLCAVQYLTWVSVILAWATSKWSIQPSPAPRRHLLTSLLLRAEPLASRGAFTPAQLRKNQGTEVS